MGASHVTSQPDGQQGVDLYLPSEAAERLRVNVRTVYRLMSEGHLTAVCVGSKLRRCRVDEVEAMVKGDPVGVSGVPSQRTTR